MTINPKPRYDYVILVLQGGGALRAYQAGVFEGMTEAGYVPDWITGVSMGAINGALIAGNPPKQRIERMRDFWDRVSSSISLGVPPFFSAFHRGVAHASATLGSVVGVPGFFVPRVPPPAFMPDGAPGALSVYDVDPLRMTFAQLVDFLREVEALSYKEIARIMDAPIGTVMSRLSRARQALQRELPGDEHQGLAPKNGKRIGPADLRGLTGACQ